MSRIDNGLSYRVEGKGGTGGDIKAYVYAIQTFSASTPPDNNKCAGAQAIDLMQTRAELEHDRGFDGQELASDDHSAANCVAEGGLMQCIRLHCQSAAP